MGALVAAGLLAACTSGDREAPAGTGPTADGWATYEGDGVTFSHPPDWEIRDEGEGRVDVVGPETGELPPMVVVRWAAPVGLSATESLQAATGNVVTTVPDAEPGEVETFETSAGLEAVKRRIEYTEPLDDGAVPVVELQAVVLGDDVEVLVRAAHPADGFEQFEDIVEDLLVSVEPGGNGGADTQAARASVLGAGGA